MQNPVQAAGKAARPEHSPSLQRNRVASHPISGGLEMRAQGFMKLKVMMVTSETGEDFIRRSLDAGADEYLIKPFDDQALTEKLVHLGFVPA